MNNKLKCRILNINTYYNNKILHCRTGGLEDAKSRTYCKKQYY